jgi:signal transduction histidine kinase/HAMP domain-containing protein
MQIKNLKTGTQIKLYFIVFLGLVLLLGLIAYKQTNQINDQNEIMYQHPLVVRRAISEFKINTISIQNNLKNWMLADQKHLPSFFVAQNELYKSATFKDLETLYSRFLGPTADIDSLKTAFIQWNAKNDEIIQLLQTGNNKKAVQLLLDDEIKSDETAILFRKLEKVDLFTNNKAEELYKYSDELNNSLNWQLLFIVLAICLFSIYIGYRLFKGIQTPIHELLNSVRKFQQGDLKTRSSYISDNEFGTLSKSFNEMVTVIESNTLLAEKEKQLAAMMLKRYDKLHFFASTLQMLASFTESEMAAVYLLSEDLKEYNLFYSIGLAETARQSFSSSYPVGELSTAIASKEIVHIHDIPEDTRFVFNTTVGNLLPRDIIVIPIVIKENVMALISLSGIHSYTPNALQFVKDIHSFLSSRIEGVLANHRIETFSHQLEIQNKELESQKTELIAQSAQLREQNTELEIQKEQLNEASKLKTNFLSTMSHELRTPLNSVIALSGILSRKLAHKIPEEDYSYLEVVERNGKHLLELINDILDIARIESGKNELEITAFNLNELLEDLNQMILPQARQKNIELLYCNPSSPIYLQSDIGKCRHILQNLIANAVKFTEKGSVELATNQTDQGIEITITDTGIGIAATDLLHIFDEFRQADSSTSRRFGGTGLGLAIAKKYTALLGGTIEVESTPDIGSKFTLLLPLRHPYAILSDNIQSKADRTLSLNKVNPILTAETSAKTILLVEDSEPAIIQIKDLIEESGFKLHIAQNGMEALKILETVLPDTIILDLMMPGMDGFEVLRNIRASQRTEFIPVLILTAKHITKEELSFLKRNNIHQLIQKGDINRKELLQSIYSTLQL